jgi:Tfp pilus assembly protein PilN
LADYRLTPQVITTEGISQSSMKVTTLLAVLYQVIFLKRKEES